MISQADYTKEGFSEVVLLEETNVKARTIHFQERFIHKIVAKRGAKYVSTECSWVMTPVAKDPRRIGKKKFVISSECEISQDVYESLKRAKGGCMGEEKDPLTETLEERKRSSPPCGPGLHKAMPRPDENIFPKDGSNCR